MSIVIRAHFDGKVIVPDEPVDLPVNEPIRAVLSVSESSLPAGAIARRKAASKRFTARAVRNVQIPLGALRREDLYEPPRGL